MRVKLSNDDRIVLKSIVEYTLINSLNWKLYLRAVISYFKDEWLNKFWRQRIKDQDENEDDGDESDNDQKQKSAKEEADEF